MAKTRLKTVKPTAKNLTLIQKRARIWIPLLNRMISRWVKVSFSGQNNIPENEPVLFLANHCSFFDPLLLGAAATKQVNFLATESNFRNGIIGRFFVHHGAIPKMKYTSDARAIISLKKWADLGANIGIFPEGERTWDGKPLPVVSGTEKLVKLLDLPIVTLRIYNGFRQSPRWAKRLRIGRIHIEVDPPYEFDPTASLIEIRKYIENHIAVDALNSPRFPVKGKSFSEGLSNVVWACPNCFKIDSLIEYTSRLTCSNCLKSWHIDYDANLLGEKKCFSLPEAIQKIQTHYKNELSNSFTTPVLSEPLTLFNISEDRPKKVGSGTMRLTKDELIIEGTLTWAVAIKDITTITVDMRRRLTIRVGKKYFEILAPTESVLKWEWFIKELKASS